MNDELKHYGILGMKWGVRRGRNVLSRYGGRKKSTKGWSKDAKEANRLKKKEVSQMSNAELRKLNERSQLEKNYSSLNRRQIAKGAALLAGAVTITSNAVNLYNNSSKIVEIGRKVVGK